MQVFLLHSLFKLLVCLDYNEVGAENVWPLSLMAIIYPKKYQEVISD